jgi:thioester reductase-like protein
VSSSGQVLFRCNPDLSRDRPSLFFKQQLAARIAVTCYLPSTNMATTSESTAVGPVVDSSLPSEDCQSPEANSVTRQTLHTHHERGPERKAMVVVGTTGFLGPYIVASLLEAHPLSNIFCINRSLDGEQRTVLALERLGVGHASSLVRLRFLVADITKPNMGIDQGKLLASEVDEVVFNAWNSNWSLPLKSFDPLLDATRSAIAFCTSSPSQTRMTFISSVCAVGEWPREHPDQPVIPERVAWDNASAMAHGYGESKCVAEQLLASAHAVSGLRVAIVRAGQIGGPALACTKRGAWPVQRWLYFIISTSEKVGCWPACLQPLDWIPVDALAAGIGRITRAESTDRTMQVFNMVHPQPAPWRLLFTTLQGRFGLRAKEVSLCEWLDKLDPETLKLYDFLRAAGSGREHNMMFSKSNALQVLPELAPITDDLLAAWLEGWNLKLGGFKARM